MIVGYAKQVNAPPPPFVAGRFMAVSYHGVTTTSTDGINWTPGNIGADDTLAINDIIYVPGSPGAWLIYGDSDLVYRSTDAGASWSSFNIGFVVNSFALRPNNRVLAAGKILGSPAHGTVKYSDDAGLTWHTSSVLPAGLVQVNFTASSGSMLLGIATRTLYNNVLMSSPDGDVWTELTSPFGNYGTSIFNYLNGEFVAVSNVSNSWVLRTSANGAAWTTVTLNGGQNNPNSIGFNGQSRYAICGDANTNALAYTDDPFLTTWNFFDWPVAPANDGAVFGVVFGAGLWVLAGFKNSDVEPGLWTSPDMITLTERNSGIDFSSTQQPLTGIWWAPGAP